MVEAVRSGTIFSTGKQGQRQYDRWRARSRSRPGAKGGGGLTGAALERAVLGLAARHPEYVVMGGAKA